MNFKNINTKKTLLIILAVAVAGYVIWDISVKVVNYLRLQGYQFAVMEMIKQAENEECLPFSIFTGDKSINLVNVACLQMENNAQEQIIFEEEMDIKEKE